MNVQIVPSGLEPYHAYLVLGGFAIIFVGLALVIRVIFVKSTHDFLVAGRRVGLGFGVGSVIASWTWAMAVMMSAAMAYSFGVSGLWWFTIPNGLAIIAIIPFGIYLRKNMPHGYTLSQYIYHRFDKNLPLYIVFIASMLFGCFLMAVINLKGTSVVMSTIFGIDWRVVPVIAGMVVITYVAIGGMWNSAVTAGIQTFLIMLPASVVVVAVLEKVGGADLVIESLRANKPADYLEWYRPATAFAFGITLALGLLSNTVSDQTFWERIWAVKAKYVGRVFLWGGTWFYGIPICLGVLGLVGASMGVDLERDLGGDAAAVGPYVVANIGLPGWLVVAYTVAILAACLSTLDAAFIGTSAIVSVDIVKRLAPEVTDKMLLVWARVAVLAIGLLSVGVILTGVDFVTIVLTTYALKTSVLLPLIMAVFWNKVNGNGIFWGIISAIAVGMPVFFTYGEFAGTFTIIVISLVIPVAWTMVSPRPFDTKTLQVEITDLYADAEAEPVSGEASVLRTPGKDA